MKIGFDAKRLFCNFTGLGNYSRSLVANMLERYPENGYRLYSPKTKERPETAPFLGNPDLPVFCPPNKFSPLWRSYGITGQLEKDGLNLFHGLSNELPLNIGKSKVKSLVTIHDLIFKIYPHTYPFFDRIIYDFKIKQSCRQSDGIIAISQSAKNDLVFYYGVHPDKIEVVYQACNPLFYKPIEKHEAVGIAKKYGLPAGFLLSVGSVEERKNLKNTLRALALLPPSLQTVLAVVGRGGRYKYEAQALSRSLGLEKKVFWFDKLHDNRHLQALYQEASVLLYPSLYEGFGLPVAEALLCGTPVVTSKASSLPEAGGPGALYVNPLHPEQIAAAAEKLLSDTSLSAAMALAGRKYAAEKFSGQSATDALFSVYRKITGF